MGFKTSKHIWRGPHTVSTEHRSWQQGGVQRRSRSRNLRYFLRGARPFVASGFKPLPIKNWQSGNATTTGSWFQPLWKIWKSVGIIIPNIYGKMKNVPNHQPETILSGYGSQCWCWYMLVKNSSRVPHQSPIRLRWIESSFYWYSYGHLPVITGYFYAIIHSINGVLLVLITDKWP